MPDVDASEGFQPRHLVSPGGEGVDWPLGQRPVAASFWHGAFDAEMELEVETRPLVHSLEYFCHCGVDLDPEMGVMSYGSYSCRCDVDLDPEMEMEMETDLET